MPNVQYRPLEHVMDDCNKLAHGSTHFEYWQVPRSASNKPEDSSGVIVYFPMVVNNIAGESEGKFGLQLYYCKNGNVHARTYEYTYGSVKWGNWSRINGIASPSPTTGNFLARPEDERPIQDANSLNYSGIFRTTDTTSHLPEGVNPTWGVLQHFYENNGSNSKAGFQLYAPIDGTGFGNLYIRVFNVQNPLTGNASWKRLNLRKILELQDQVYSHPTEVIQTVDANTPTGFYLTTEQTQGMDGIPVGKRDGVVKVTKDGDISLQRFQTSEAGNTDIYLRTLTSAVTTSARIAQETWTKVTQNHANIIDTRNEQVGKPVDYAIHSNRSESELGYYFYEWKYTNSFTTNGQLPNIEGNKRCILKTMIPYAQGKVTTDESDITQIAYVNDGKTFIRHGKTDQNQWGSWTDLSASGGTGGGPDFSTWTF